MTLLEKPWKVDRAGERIYAYVGNREVGIDICSGAPEDRARVMALLEQVQAIAKAVGPLAHFVAQFDAMPLRGISDELYGIHCGTEHEADIRLSDLRALAKALRDAGGSP